MSRRLRKLINDPKHWRARASAMRMLATQATDPKVKASTNGAADGYDRVAQQEEARTSLVDATRRPTTRNDGVG
jgi:hypothetical protein